MVENLINNNDIANDVDKNYDLPSGEIVLLSDWIVGNFKGFVNLDNFEYISTSDPEWKLLNRHLYYLDKEHKQIFQVFQEYTGKVTGSYVKNDWGMSQICKHLLSNERLREIADTIGYSYSE